MLCVVVVDDDDDDVGVSTCTSTSCWWNSAFDLENITWLRHSETLVLYALTVMQSTDGALA